MTLGSAALRAREDGTVEYFPAIPISLLQPAFKAEIALARGPQSRMVGHDKNLVARSAWPDNVMRRSPVYSPSEPKVLGLPILLKRALERRLYPNSNLHRKQLSYELRVSPNTIDNWLGGNNEPRGSHIMALIRFFDRSFAEEISQGHVTKITDQRAMEAIKKMAEAQRELHAALSGDR